ncbi:MAG TPA: M17 family peptidase N-terminal domain-containing protein [Polyangiaceae bacterium]
MELRFVAPDLRAIDDNPAEVIVCAMWEDERPMRGLAGLLDWRLSGRMSRLARSRFMEGKLGEVLCLQGRPRLPFDKVLLVGAGPRAAFDEAAYRTAAGAVLKTLEGLKVPRAVVELPGRAGEAITPERAAEILLDASRDAAAHDAWFLVETPEAQAKITARGREERRRVRA